MALSPCPPTGGKARVALLAGGVAAIRMASRRLARLKNNLVEVGKEQSTFVNEPKFQQLTIGSSRN